MPWEEQVERRKIRQKFVPRQNSPAVNQYKDPMVGIGVKKIYINMD